MPAKSPKAWNLLKNAPTLADLRQIPCESIPHLIYEICRRARYRLELVEGNDNTHTMVDHERRIIYIEVWCMEDSAGAVAILLHELGHILQRDGYLYMIHMSFPFLRYFTRIVLEYDASRRACSLYPYKDELKTLSQIRMYYRSELVEYVKALRY